MKKNYLISFLLLFLASLNFYGQGNTQFSIRYLGEDLKIKPKTIDELKNTVLMYAYHIDSLTIVLNKNGTSNNTAQNIKNTNDFETEISSKSLDLKKVVALRNSLKRQKVWNNTMMHLLFANEVGTYVNGGTDLSLNKYYAGLDADDSSISFAINFTKKNRSKLDRLKWIISVGFKAKAEDKFATIFKNGKFENNDLGLTGKVTLIGKGIININTEITEIESLNPVPKPILTISSHLERDDIIIKYRRDLLTRYDKKIKKYIESDYPQQLDSLKIVLGISDKEDEEDKAKDKNDKIKDSILLSKKIAEFVNTKYEDFYEKIASEEIKFMKKNKLYHFLWDHWGSIDFFLPIGQKKYNISLLNTDPNFKSTSFYPFKINGTYTNFLKFSNGQSIYLTGQISTFNNNNIKADDISKIAFQTISPQSTTQQAVVDSDDVYVVANGYKNFVTGAAKVEVVYFFCNWIGLSSAAEKNFGQYYHPFNWKIGAPISLKDKDGKPNVNLEAQFKRVNNTDIWGISVSFLVGKFLN